jgi:hypothetical protein
MSANEYMETVTSFSASLLQGLGGDTERAADYANMAITDMSDNANKMGTDISMIQNAYQGFAKQNYTMLDNLKLGYGGTAEEMARLVNDSGVLGAAITVDAKSLKQVPFHKIIDAINVIQDRMGIAGTTLAEATDTISGSFSALGATWTNLLTGLASGDQDIDTLVDNFLQAGETLATNVFKVLPRLMQNIGKAASRLMQSVGKKLNEVWTGSVWPWLQETLKAKLGINLPEWSEVVSTLTSWWNTAKSAFDQVCTWTLNLFDHPHETALEIGAALSTWWTDTALPAIKSVSTWALNLFGVPVEDDATIIEHIGGWWKAAGKLVAGACSWVLQLFGMPKEDADTITTTVSKWWSGAVDLVTNACEWSLKFHGLKEWTDEDTAAVRTWWGSVCDTILGIFEWEFDPFELPDAEEKANEIIAWMESVMGSVGKLIKNSMGITPASEDYVNTVQTTVSNLGPTGMAFVSNPDSFYNFSWFADWIRGTDGSHANGLDYVPRNGYRSMLHEGEAVLNSREASDWRSGNIGSADAVAAAVREAMGGIQFNVMLDSGALVGQLAPQMDASLGALAGRKGRRN